MKPFVKLVVLFATLTLAAGSAWSSDYRQTTTLQVAAASESEQQPVQPASPRTGGCASTSTKRSSRSPVEQYGSLNPRSCSNGAMGLHGSIRLDLDAVRGRIQLRASERRHAGHVRLLSDRRLVLGGCALDMGIRTNAVLRHIRSGVLRLVWPWVWSLVWL